MTVEELIRNCDDLPTLPDVYLRVKEVVENPKASMVDLARALSVDPAMTAKVLKLVNSSFYGLSGKIETVSRAASILGMQPIHDLVLATSVGTAFSKASSPIMDMHVFWQSSVERGLLARLTAKWCNLVDSERLFVGGLLCDIGHLVIFQHIPDLAAQALNQAKTEKTRRTTCQRELLGFDAAEVGAELLKEWNLPLNYQQGTRHHMNPSQVPDCSLEIEILHIAGMITECQLLDIPRDQWMQWITVEDKELQELTDEDLDGFMAVVQEDLHMMLDLISPALARATVSP